MAAKKEQENLYWQEMFVGVRGGGEPERMELTQAIERRSFNPW
jgi:hypothetical protein